MVYANEHDLDRAETELRRALAIDPAFVPASVNLAELDRVRGRDDEAETCLRQALARVPDDSALHYTLGLVLVRQHRMPEALEQLAAAAHDGTDDARRGYVYAVALHDTGDVRGARRELERVLRRHPDDRDALAALQLYAR
jgi:Flp pilus assembly protein TadD